MRFIARSESAIAIAIVTVSGSTPAPWSGRGRRWARPPPRGLPRTTAQRPFEDVSVGFFRFLACAVVRSRVCSLCIMYPKTVCSRFRPAKSRAQNLPGTRFLHAYFCFCYLGGGSLDGGDHVSPRFETSGPLLRGVQGNNLIFYPVHRDFCTMSNVHSLGAQKF